MTASAATMRRNCAPISSRRAMIAASGAGINMRHLHASRRQAPTSRCSALPGLKARIGLVDDVDPTSAPHDLAVLVTLLQRLQRVGDFHDSDSGSEAGTIKRPPGPVNLGTAP